MPVIQVQPWGDDQGDFVLIEEADFNPEFHTLFGESAAGDGKAKLTAAEIKAKLTELGVDFKGNAARDVLQALLDSTLEERVKACKAALTEKGVEFAEDADLATLQALLEPAA